MKLLLLVLFVVGGLSISAGSDGVFRTKRPKGLIDFVLDLTLTPDTSLLVDETTIKYYFYSKTNKGTEFNQFNISSVDFAIVNRTIFIIHGWMNTYLDEMAQSVKDGYLHSQDVNIVIVDWSVAASKDYVTAKYWIPTVGEIIGKFIRYMKKNTSLELDNIGFVGHSLGAHVSGIVGKSLNGHVNHIVALDPAGPLYDKTSDEEKLAKGDAQFVQVIHTGAGILGYNGDLGDADYWPNGGTPSQPACGIDLLGDCSHDMSYKYYTESLLTGGFIGKQCSDYLSYLIGSCENNTQGIMGEDARDRSTGNFYLTTNSEPPYAQF